MYGLEAYLLGLELEVVLGNSDRTGTSSLTSLSSWAGHCCAAGRLPIISTMRLARSKAFYLLLLDMNELIRRRISLGLEHFATPSSTICYAPKIHLSSHRFFSPVHTTWMAFKGS